MKYCMRTGNRRTVLAAVMAIMAMTAVGVVPTGCSPKRMAVNMIGNALSGDGGVFTADPDPELVKEAIPFGLKTYESLLESSPKHRGLLLAAASGFTAYAYMLQEEADRIDATDVVRARHLRVRSRGLYLRGRDFALRGLAVKHKGFETRIRSDRQAALAETGKKDVALLYWAGAAWAGALSAKKSDFLLMAELPIAAALVTRSMELDESYEGGAAHEFLISYEGGRPGGSAEVARAHYEKALALSEGKRASVYVALAEAVTVGEQNYPEFTRLIDAALAVDVEAAPNIRVANTMAQSRARWLKSRAAELFVDVP